jgi:hypothetical protein
MVGMKISDVFKIRARNVTAPLTSIHHDAMDILYSANFDTFNLAKMIELLEMDGTIMRHEIVEENSNRIRLISARTLDGLLETELIKKASSGNDGSYCWNVKK